MRYETLRMDIWKPVVDGIFSVAQVCTGLKLALIEISLMKSYVPQEFGD